MDTGYPQNHPQSMSSVIVLVGQEMFRGLFHTEYNSKSPRRSRKPLMSPSSLHWVQCEGDQWCSLNTVNLSHSHFSSLQGVYIIWHGGTRAHTVYVGQGVIADRLAEHRKELQYSEYAGLGLFVTWAKVDAHNRNGVERFLAEKLSPLRGLKYPASTPIPVNLPW